MAQRRARRAAGLAAEAMLAMLDANDGEPSRCAKPCATRAPRCSRAQASGDVREGVDIDDLVRMVQAIRLAADDSNDPDTAERLFAFMLDGVRPR